MTAAKIFPKLKNITRCKYGTVKEVWLGEKEVVIIHSPAFFESAYRRQIELAKQGLDVLRLNTGNEYDRELAEFILSYCEDFKEEGSR